MVEGGRKSTNQMIGQLVRPAWRHLASLKAADHKSVIVLGIFAIPISYDESIDIFIPQTLSEELSKERAAREALKEVVATAESMLRVARARISTLERQLKDSRAELETTRKKHKDLEQLVNNSQVTKTL